MPHATASSRIVAVVGGLVLLGSSVIVPAAIVAAAPPAPHATTVTGAAVSYRTASTRGHVVVRDAARTSKVHRTARSLPAIRPTRRPAAPRPHAKTVTPAPPVLASTSGTPSATVTSFAGISHSTPGEASVEPPDPWVAVGPDDVVQVVNLLLRITSRTGQNVIDVPLPDFFALPIDGSIADTDPHVVYDALHGRWIATEASWDCTPGGGATIGHGYVDIAVSNSADPRGLWSTYFGTYNDQFPDFPGFGTSTDKVVISTNVFNMVAGSGFDCIGSTPAGADMTAFDWSDLINGGGLGASYVPVPNVFTLRPAVQAPATSPDVHWVAYRANGLAAPGWDETQGTVIGSVAAHTIAPIETSLADLVAPPLSTSAPNQPGSPATIVDAVDERITDAMWQANRLTWVATYPCTPTGDSTLRDCVRVTQLDTSNRTLLQDFLVAQNGKDSYMGGIGITGNGALHVVWTRSSTTAGDFASTYSAYQLPSDAPDSLSAPQVLAAGDATYPGTRWGDFVGVAQDPQDPNAVWQADEYSTGGSWATVMSQDSTGSGATYVPIAPVRVLNTISGIGLSGRFKSGIPRTFQVAGVLGIPANVKAITGNVAITGQTGAGFVSLTPFPTSTPATSTLNFPVHDVRANNLTAPLSPTGALSALYKSTPGTTTQLVLDVTGYFLADDSGATYHAVAPVRLLNTIASVGLPGKFHSGVPRSFQVTGVLGIPANATAITGNLAVTRQSSAGFVSITPDPTTSPSTSTINFPVADVRANGLTAQLSATGSLAAFFNGTAGATTDLVLDVTGYYVQDLTGLHFFALNPGRRINTTIGSPIPVFHASVPQTVAMDGHEGVPVGASAITGNIAVLAQTQAGFVSITPDPTVTPATSTINFPVGDVRANGVTVPVNGGGSMSFVYISGAGKTTHLVLDVSGYFK
jgi:hypothetical protein